MQRIFKIFILSLVLSLFPSCSMGPSVFPSTGGPNSGSYYGKDGTYYGNNATGGPGGPGGPGGQGPGGAYSSSSAGNQTGSGLAGAGLGASSPGSGLVGGSQGGTIADRNSDLPYELIVDTISAATCHNFWAPTGKNSALVFASNHEGLKVRRDFLDSNNLSDRSDPKEILEKLQNSPLRSVRAHVGLYDEDDPYRRPGFGGKEIIGHFPIFHNPHALTLLSRGVRDGGGVFASRSVSDRSEGGGGKWQAFLPRPFTGAVLREHANQLSGGSLGQLLPSLRYTFKNQLMESKELAPYGKGYKMWFNDPIKADYLVKIQEENLNIRRYEGDWYCPKSARFMILREKVGHRSSLFNQMLNGDYKQSRFIKSNLKDVGEEASCNTTKLPPGFTDNSGGYFIEQTFGRAYKNDLEVGTVQLPGGTSTDYPCIVPRKIGCYHLEGLKSIPRFEFDPSKQENCTPTPYHVNPGTYEYYKICPAYLSACIREP